MRHGYVLDFDPKPGVSISTLAYDYPAGCRLPDHAHRSGQLIYATSGVMEVSASQSLWVIPTHFAIWIPAHVTHRIRMNGAVSMRTLYLRPRVAAGLPDRCGVLRVTPLLRELVVEAVRTGSLRAGNPIERALRDVIVTQLRNASTVPTSLTLPQDARALAVAQSLMANLAQSPPLHALCRAAGASVRTVERVFRRETGMTVEVWRRQARLMKAVELLARGCSVKEVAFAVGYRQPSAFVEMFRQTMGTTPKRWASGRDFPARSAMGHMAAGKSPGGP